MAVLLRRQPMRSGTMTCLKFAQRYAQSEEASDRQETHSQLVGQASQLRIDGRSTSAMSFHDVCSARGRLNRNKAAGKSTVVNEMLLLLPWLVLLAVGRLFLQHYHSTTRSTASALNNPTEYWKNQLLMHIPRDKIVKTFAQFPWN